MRGDEARLVCPEIQLVQVPTAHGKADLTHYRFSGSQARPPYFAPVIHGAHHEHRWDSKRASA